MIFNIISLIHLSFSLIHLICLIEMTVKPVADASQPEPDSSTLQPSAHLIAYLSTPVGATKEDARIAHPLVTCTPLMAAYGVPTTEIDPQTTHVRGRLDQSTVEANDASLTQDTGNPSEKKDLYVEAIGVEYVYFSSVVPLTPPDNLPDFDAALWHEFALEVAHVHLGAK